MGNNTDLIRISLATSKRIYTLFKALKNLTTNQNY